MKKAISKSRTGSGDLKSNATRNWSGATSESYFKPVAKSGYSGMGDPSGVQKAEVMTSASYMKPIDKSMPGVPVEPKKWTKRGYDMSLPTTLSKS